MSDAPTTRPCPGCGEGILSPFARVDDAPTHVGLLWPTREAAIDCPRGDLELGHCDRCGFVHNLAFDPSLADYAQAYDNALHFSGVFQEYERDLAARLVDRYGLRDADVLEIGCGTGHFLGLLCATGDNRGIGFDPSHDPAHADPLLGDRARVVPEYFGPEHASVPADMVCCRHVLEHVPQPDRFLATVRQGIGDRTGTVLYLEVPNGLLALRRLSVGDLIYEHATYFVASSLRRMVEGAGFEVLDLHEAYDGQFLGLEARPAAPGAAPAPPTDDLAGDVPRFAERMDERVAGWRALVEGIQDAGERAVAWGAGAKAVGFFNLLGLREGIDRVVDLNPRKQGTYLAGTGQRIVAPEDLVADPPDAVLIMNPLYAEEIGATLKHLGVPARIVPV